MQGSRITHYGERFDRVFDHIEQHLDEPLTVDGLSQVARFSKFHFHRQFSEYAGISVHRYILLLRLKRASYRLAFHRQSRILDIALEAGFESPEAFARSFKQTFGQTPTQFREAPDWLAWTARFSQPIRRRSTPMDVTIVEREAMTVAVLEHHGAPDLIHESIRTFIEWRKASGLSPVATSKTLGLAYAESDGDPAQFRWDICATVTGPVPPNPQGVVSRTIPAGRWATVRHVGSHDRLRESAGYLYREWLPASGEELRDFPVMFDYVSRMPQTPEHEQITDVYLPLV